MRARATAAVAAASRERGSRAGGPFSRPAASLRRPEPLTLAELDAVKRAALFG